MKKISPGTKQALKIGLSILLLFLLFRMVDWQKAQGIVRQASPLYLLLAVALLTVERAVSVLKWLVLLRVKGSVISFWRLFLINYIGGFWSLFAPSSVSADIIRGYYLSKKTADISLTISSIVVDHILSLFGLILVGATGAYFFGDKLGLEHHRLYMGIIMALMIAGFIAIQNRAFMDLVNRIFIRRITIRNMNQHLEKWFQACVDYGKFPVTLLFSFSLSILVQAIRVVIFYVVALGFDVNVSVVYYFMFVPVVNMAIMLPVFNGIGVREACFVAFAKYVGIDRDVALVVSSAVSLVTTLTTALGGIIYLFDRDIGKPEKETKDS
ncbi:MAG: hypothetical protein C0404_00460 [Verrucomicrobia bacterium]|nr:hypothetical protein [Verrucomicrobiota bacterium]